MLTTHMQVFALYAGLNALILLVLSLLVSRARSKHGVMLGDGGSPQVLQAMRAQANAVEYMPIVLILLLTLAGMKASTILLHVIGAMLTFGRILHPIGLYQKPGVSVGRALGMLLTWAALLVAAITCLTFALVA